ncbi:hypothetical protein [Streptomyces sp.]|uniref:hypothetical protein n=1 Tax=Streptomyces sp. TaxID=1931 RepID=UPI002D76E1B8|nr:hypothetical protein [Streptomyces sp.]HET6355953.1 hypothetical protein [Streptomyces sp.]
MAVQVKRSVALVAMAVTLACGMQAVDSTAMAASSSVSGDGPSTAVQQGGEYGAMQGIAPLPEDSIGTWEMGKYSFVDMLQQIPQGKRDRLLQLADDAARSLGGVASHDINGAPGPSNDSIADLCAQMTCPTVGVLDTPYPLVRSSPVIPGSSDKVTVSLSVAYKSADTTTDTDGVKINLGGKFDGDSAGGSAGLELSRTVAYAHTEEYTSGTDTRIDVTPDGKSFHLEERMNGGGYLDLILVPYQTVGSADNPQMEYYPVVAIHWQQSTIAPSTTILHVQQGQ